MLTEPCRSVFKQFGRWIVIKRESLTGPLLDELAGHEVSLRRVREQFRQVLLAHQAQAMVRGRA